MLADFLLKRKIAELVRRSRDVHRLDQYDSIDELGKLPPTDESLACLIEHTRMHQQNSGAAIRAISALGMMNDRRATDHLVRLIREKEGRIEDAIEKALGQPHHASALPELAEMARVLCRDHDDVFLAKCMTDLMRSIDPLASQPHIEALAPLVLACALRELPSNKPSYGRPDWGESVLALCQQPAGRAALQTLQDALVQHHRKIIMTSDRYDSISDSLSWLRTSTRPAAAATVTEFMRTPSRQVTKLVSRVVSDDDDPAVQYVWEEIGCDTSELGQPRSLEELAERDAIGPAATDHARQAYHTMKAEREHREKVYPDLLNLGDQRDLEDYAQACLKDAVYDAYFVPPAESHEPSKPKLNYLALFLQRAPDNTKAAELLTLILAADRTRLWASTREAFALRQTLPAWPPEINWKPLALELLKQTGDPALDEFLTSRIEADRGASEPSLLWKTIERRNPTELLDLAARLLLRRTAYTIPSNDRRWKEASTRKLLSDTLLCGTDLDLALDVVLASAPTALRIAREMHGRRKRRDRIPGYLIMCLLTGPEVEVELSAWVAAEADHRIWEVVDQQKGAEFVKRCKAAAAQPPSAQSAPVPAAHQEEAKAADVTTPPVTAGNVTTPPGSAPVVLFASEHIANFRREPSFAALSRWERWRLTLRERDWKVQFEALWKDAATLLGLSIFLLIAAFVLTSLFGRNLGAMVFTGALLTGLGFVVCAIPILWTLAVAGFARTRLVHVLIAAAVAVVAVPGVNVLLNNRVEKPFGGTSEHAAEALAAGNVGAAIAAARTATRQVGDAQSFETYGAALDAGHRFKDAAKAYTEVIRLNPNDVAAYLGRAEARRAAGDLKGAIEDYRAIVNLEPDSPLYRQKLESAEGKLSARESR